MAGDMDPDVSTATKILRLVLIFVPEEPSYRLLSRRSVETSRVDPAVFMN